MMNFMRDLCCKSPTVIHSIILLKRDANRIMTSNYSTNKERVIQ